MQIDDPHAQLARRHLLPARVSTRRLLRHLAERRERKIGHDLRAARAACTWRSPWSAGKSISSSNDRRLPVAQDDAGAHALAEIGVGHGDAGDVLHRRMRQDQVLDLLGADLLAAAVDQVLLAALDHVVARGMLAHQIARAVEAVGGESRGVVLGRAVISAQRVGPAAAEFADFARRHDVVVLVEKPHFVVGADRAVRPSPAARLRDRRARTNISRPSAMPKFSCTNALGDQLLVQQPHFRLQALAAALDRTAARRGRACVTAGLVDASGSAAPAPP